MLGRVSLVLMVLLLVGQSSPGQAQTLSQEPNPEVCFATIGCLDQGYARLADVQTADCTMLASMRAALSARQPKRPLNLKERANLRLIARVERQKNCRQIVAKAKKVAPGEVTTRSLPKPEAPVQAPVAEAPKSAAEVASELQRAGTIAGDGAAKPATPAKPSAAKKKTARPLATKSASAAPVAAVEAPAPAAPAPAASAEPPPPPVAAAEAPAAANGSVTPPVSAEPPLDAAPASSMAASTADADDSASSSQPASPSAATGALTAPDAAKPASDLPYITQTVFYATDRKGTGKEAPNERYSGDRGTLVLGTAEVSIPKAHQAGELEAPSIWRLEFSENPASHITLLSVTEQATDAYYADVAARVSASPGRNAFIFVHGYNVAFKDAARRTAQMAYDLRFDGAAAFFSWPSQGTTLGYKYDEGNVEWATPDLKSFIADFAARSGADNLYLVGHSMGTRALTAALKELFQEDPATKARIREVILAAPDIDADVFKRSIAPIFKGTDMVTLYASSKDKALSLSRQFNGYPRAGDSGSGLVVVSGVDTIEASDVDTDFVGHAYFGASTSIITDMYEIVRGNTLPSSRPHLKAITDQLGAYWKIQRAAP